MKKILTILLAMVMVFSMSAVAFADDGSVNLNVHVTPGSENYEVYKGMEIEWDAWDGTATVVAAHEVYIWDTETLDWVLDEDRVEEMYVGYFESPSLSVEMLNSSSPNSMASMTPILTYTDRFWELLVNGHSTADGEKDRSFAVAFGDELTAWGAGWDAMAPADGEGGSPDSVYGGIDDMVDEYVTEDVIMNFCQYMIDAGRWDVAAEHSRSFKVGFELTSIDVQELE